MSEVVRDHTQAKATQILKSYVLHNILFKTITSAKLTVSVYFKNTETKGEILYILYGFTVVTINMFYDKSVLNMMISL